MSFFRVLRVGEPTPRCFVQVSISFARGVPTCCISLYRLVFVDLFDFSTASPVVTVACTCLSADRVSEYPLTFHETLEYVVSDISPARTRLPVHSSRIRTFAQTSKPRCIQTMNGIHITFCICVCPPTILDRSNQIHLNVQRCLTHVTPLY